MYNDLLDNKMIPSGKHSLLLLLLLIWKIDGYTSIALANCPAQFDVSAYNTTSDTTLSTLGSFVYSSFQSPTTTNTVQQIVVTGDTKRLSSYVS
jgi:hypothetical protein